MTTLKQLYKNLDYETEENLNLRYPRLFPVFKNISELEVCSVFLAVLKAIEPFRKNLLNEIEIRKVNNKTAALHTYTEISFKEAEDNKSSRPDGLIVLTSGKREPVIEWSAFIETKTGNNQIQAEQIEKYINTLKSKEYSFCNTIITISNQMVPWPNIIPYKVKNTRGLKLIHFSWMFILSIAEQTLCEVKDKEQYYILNEFLRFLNDKKTPVNHFSRMSGSWKESILDFVHHEARAKEESLSNIVHNWLQEEKDMSFILTKRSQKSYWRIKLPPGVKCTSEYVDSHKKNLKENGFLCSNFISYNDNKFIIFSKLNIIKNFYKSWFYVRAKDDLKAKGQINHFLRRLKDAGKADELDICAVYKGRGRNKKTRNILLKTLLSSENKHLSPLLDKEKGDQIKMFVVSKRIEVRLRDLSGPERIVKITEESLKDFFEQAVCSFLPC